jgi:hypothetical protein
MIVASLGVLWLTDYWVWVGRAFGLHKSTYHDGQVNLVPPVLCAGLLLVLCLVQWFAWSNFRRSGASVPRMVIQFGVILFAVALISLTMSHAAWLP